jgi:hypothetical protein
MPASNQTVSNQTFGDFGAAASDIFAGFAASDKRKGDELESQNYSEAATLALQNEQFTKTSTGIQTAQNEREVSMSLGKTQAEVAGAGFADSGSAVDILRDSASQGALKSAVINQQGFSTEAGYQEQAESYTNMANAADAAAKGESLAQVGDFVSAGISAVAGIFSLGTDAAGATAGGSKGGG